MRTSRTLRLLFLASMVSLSLCSTAVAQSFDSDSIYYTPLGRPVKATVDGNVGIFRDTTQSGKCIAYYFDISMGMLTGCADCPNGREFTISMATTHGITWGRKTRIGGGVGVDTYLGWRAVPLFGSVSYDLAGTKNTHAVFVQAQYGWGFTWRETLPYEMAPADVKGGVMFAALIGYRVRYHDLRIGITTGFKQQSAWTHYETDTWLPNETGEMVKGTPNRTTVETTLGRAVLNLTFSWR
ncbi:MAG TPA: hypothetical protein VK658_26025 [Chryseolinea sp.]|nr:hypothetical protein [Chryseolinea sp.]